MWGLGANWFHGPVMFLRCKKRHKDGKEHLYWSIVENRRIAGGRVLQRQVLYLGELNGRQEVSWQKTIDLFARDGDCSPQQVSLFPQEHLPADSSQREIPAIGVRLSEMRLLKPRQWGACWLGCQLWEQLGLDDFWAQHLPVGRQGARWADILKMLAIYRLVSPGSQWRLHRHWFDHSAMADLLGGDFGLAQIHRLYECHDKVLEHKTALFNHLTERWKTIFEAKFEVLLYDLTSTYFESNPPFPEDDKRKFGYSRDKRSDCVQVVIALIVTPQGFPIAYEVLVGNTADKTTLRDFLEKIQTQYGKADRIWVMDRGIPTEEVLQEMRESDPPVSYLVGTPKGRLTTLEKDLLPCPWKNVRPNVQVKLLAKDGETYVLAQTQDRIAKERAMRRRRLRKYIKCLADLQDRKTPLRRDAFHQALGAAKKDAGRDARHVEVTVQLHGKGKNQTVSFTYTLDRKNSAKAAAAKAATSLRTNLTGAFMVARQMDRDIVGQYPCTLVNVASMYALNGPHHAIYEGMPFRSFSAYSTTKAGIHGLTLWLAGYWARRQATVNTIAPGAVFNDHSDEFQRRVGALIMGGPHGPDPMKSPMRCCFCARRRRAT
ncbi:MAG: IS1634 family transposase [Sphingomonadales bacterium]|nr:IS1634 family transposase [Sphingomonadales bacterium]